MARKKASLEVIEDFLAQKRIALVGLSRKPIHFSAMLFQEMCRRGYDVVPVNPKACEIRGHRCYARVQDIQPPVDGVLLMTSPEITDEVVRDCAESGVQRVWMYRAGGKGAVSEAAVTFCREREISIVPGECPFKFWPHSGFHRLHGFVLKIMGQYPRRERAA